MESMEWPHLDSYCINVWVYVRHFAIFVSICHTGCSKDYGVKWEHGSDMAYQELVSREPHKPLA